MILKFWYYRNIQIFRMFHTREAVRNNLPLRSWCGSCCAWRRHGWCRPPSSLARSLQVGWQTTWKDESCLAYFGVRKSESIIKCEKETVRATWRIEIGSVVRERNIISISPPSILLRTRHLPFVLEGKKDQTIIPTTIIKKYQERERNLFLIFFSFHFFGDDPSPDG